jgi:hypothetical protein
VGKTEGRRPLGRILKSIFERLDGGGGGWQGLDQSGPG